MRRALLLVLCSGLFAVGVREAAAQTPRVERPYRGLFGGDVDNPASLLVINASMGGGYDTNVLLENSTAGGGVVDPGAAAGSAFSSLAAAVSYALNKTRFGFGASASTTARYYPDLADSFVPAHSGSVAASLKLTKSATLTGTQTISYQPYLSLFGVPQLYESGLGQLPPADIDLGTGDQDYVSYTSNAEWSQRLTQRATLTFFYSRELSDFSEGATTGDFSNSLAAGRFSYSIGRGLSARIGYGYQDARYGGTENGDFTGSTFDAGIDFNRALSISRRTTLTFATGSSANNYRNVTYFRFLGNARLIREIGRTWSAALAYDRTVELQPAYPEPVLGDAATLAVSGLINRRLQFTSSARALIGNVGFGGGGLGKGFETYTGSVGVTVGFTRNIGLNTSYTYYSYSFEEGALPPGLIGLPLQTNRHGVQANLVIWAPLFYRARKPDATR